MIYNLTHTIENSARLHPDRLAFCCGQDSLSYNELNVKTKQVATYLINAGVQKGDRIGIYMDRCIETAIAVYGIMKAGASYVPLDPSAPHSRTSFLVEDCEIKHLLTTKKQDKRILAIIDLQPNIKSIIGNTLSLAIPTISWKEIFEISITDYKPVKILESDLAYIMYTSGSTGTPKGIMHTHHSGLTFAKLSSQVYGLNFEDRVANHAPLHFDISTFGYFSAPLASATTVIIPDAYTKLPASLSTLMEKEKITIWYSVPLAIVQLLFNGVLEKRDLSSLRWVMYGGENFVPKYMTSLMKIWPDATFSNVYGPAEVNQCTYFHIENPPNSNDQIPIGKIWGNSTHKIIDANGAEVKKGSSGELIVRTATMMKGYWNNPKLTKKSIFKETIAPGIENVFYKTGDMVREDENDNLIFLGRNDRQIKIRGYRVELDEVESVLSRHNEVREVAVIINEKEDESKEIIAVVILKSGATETSESLIAYCRTSLPNYAAPGQIYFLSEFPRTSSGKIKRSEIVEIINI